MAEVSISALRKQYGKTEVLHGIDLDIADGEFVVLVGPSGCGKSTTLRLIAGLEAVTAGSISIGGQQVNNLEPKERNIAMVFQNYAIYPHMSVRKNIGFGLRKSKESKARKRERIEEVAEILEMTDYLDRRPDQLSGGQRQRVAIGRAMVRDPAVFLFDEPLSNLDAQLRTQMRLEIKKLHQRVGQTVVFVTHDQVEAMTMADRIVIMKDGYIQQVGAPAEVFHEPQNQFVASFIGAPPMNILPGTVAGNELQLENGLSVSLTTPQVQHVLDSRVDKVSIGLRPVDLVVGGEEGHIFSGKISVVEPLGAEALAYVDVAGTEITAMAHGRTPPLPGEQVFLSIDPANLHFFDSSSGNRL